MSANGPSVRAARSKTMRSGWEAVRPGTRRMGAADLDGATSPGDPIEGGALTSVSPTFLAIDGRGRVAFLGVVAGARAVVVADATGLHVLAPRIPDFVTAFAPG